MYHPTRGGVRGGRDQFSWDDVKVDKHRENYIGHSIKAPVGRWQKGKDLHWYTRDKKAQQKDMEAAQEEIRRIKEEEEQAMREALGLAPKRATRPQGTRLDKHEFSELTKRGSTAEDLGAGHSEAARVDGLGFSKLPKPWEEQPSSPSAFPSNPIGEPVEKINASPIAAAPVQNEEESEDERSQKKKRREEKRREKDERREKRHLQDTDDRKKRSRDSDDRRKRSRDSDDKRKHSRDSDDRRKHKKDKEKRRRHDSDSD